MSITALEAARKIRLAIFDIDGVLTDGKLYFHDNGQHMKAFHCHDGVGIKLLAAVGIEIGIITSHRSPLIDQRMAQLSIKHCYQGVEKKLPVYESLLASLGLSDEVVAYVGDDFPDLPIIRRVGLGVAVANAQPIVKEFARHQTQLSGGEGAVREFAEFILQAQGLLEKARDSFL